MTWIDFALGLMIAGLAVIMEAVLDEWRDRRKKPERREHTRVIKEVLLILKRKP